MNRLCPHHTLAHRSAQAAFDLDVPAGCVSAAGTLQRAECDSPNTDKYHTWIKYQMLQHPARLPKHLIRLRLRRRSGRRAMPPAADRAAARPARPAIGNRSAGPDASGSFSCCTVLSDPSLLQCPSRNLGRCNGQGVAGATPERIMRAQ